MSHQHHQHHPHPLQYQLKSPQQSPVRGEGRFRFELPLHIPSGFSLCAVVLSSGAQWDTFGMPCACVAVWEHSPFSVVVAVDQEMGQHRLHKRLLHQWKLNRNDPLYALVPGQVVARMAVLQSLMVSFDWKWKWPLDVHLISDALLSWIPIPCYIQLLHADEESLHSQSALCAPGVASNSVILFEDVVSFRWLSPFLSHPNCQWIEKHGFPLPLCCAGRFVC